MGNLGNLLRAGLDQGKSAEGLASGRACQPEWEEEEEEEEEGVGISKHNHREAAAANNMQYAQTKERSGLELVVVVQRQILWWRSISS